MHPAIVESQTRIKIDDILNRWREEAMSADHPRARDVGSAFEKLCVAYLTHDSIQSQWLKNVRSYKEWAKSREINQSDTGIDLVAELRGEEGFVAIQCKFRAEGSTVSKSEIDSFISASESPNFRWRLIIDTTGRNWSNNAENLLRDRRLIPLDRISLENLRESTIKWEKYYSKGIIEKQPTKSLYQHQKDAVKRICKGLTTEGCRGKVIMACGTGKTIVAQRAAEQLVGVGGRVLYLVPSLALMAQVIREWSSDAEIPMRAFAVCSDAQTGKRRMRQSDDIDIDVLDLAFPATTDSISLANRARADTPDSMLVVFATYQSSLVIENAQLNNGLSKFDLAIADEAHRTAGAFIEGEENSSFVLIHENNHIFADRRLYMTATPKVYAASARTKAGKLEAALCSMDDEIRYGPVLYEIGFGEAVEKNLLSDYKVIVLTIPDGLASHTLKETLEADDSRLTIDDGAKLIGCWRALAKADSNEFPKDDRAPMSRAIAFCRDIKSSKLVEGLFSKVAEEYQMREFADLPPADVTVKHVDGTFKALERSEVLTWLSDEQDGECRILTNARCLAEGVDVPALDAILFMHPRNSQIEIVQAVGRVMRKAPGKKMGYIVLPVVIPSGVDPENALDDNERFRAVWQMLNAIRSHDERFAAMLNLLEKGEVGDRIGIVALSDWNLPVSGSDLEIGRGVARDLDFDPQKMLPGITFEDLPDAIRAKIVEKCGDRKYWDEWGKDVADIAGRHIQRIKTIVESGDAEKEVFMEFVNELRDDLNPSISEEDAIEMLAQHMVTGPVFDALFRDAEGAKFTNQNPVSISMQLMLDVLQPANIEVEADSLLEFYASVRRRVEGARTDEARQELIRELYNKFFATAFKGVKDRLGVVYTPVELIDFILYSIDEILKEEFGKTLGSKGVHILEPFAGTGTFITRLIQSGLITRENLPYKYANEIHANEIILLAYYVAAVNIETAFHKFAGDVYKTFEGICLTDTFQIQEGDDLLDQIMPDNSKRRARQKKTNIKVIIGNPPWSMGQKSQNDNAANVRYPNLDKRIKDTYVKASINKNNRSLYNSYVRAIRWASDRIKGGGVIGFVTNAGWVERSAMDGLRKCLNKEFSTIYIVHLRGNAHLQGEQRRKEKDNVFGEDTRNPVAITILVNNPYRNEKQNKIYFYDIGDYLNREQKLNTVGDLENISKMNDEGKWTHIEPDVYHDWLNKRVLGYEKYFPLANESVKAGKFADESPYFIQYGTGVTTKRDAWAYNYSQYSVKENMSRMIDVYNKQVDMVCELKSGVVPRDVLTYDPTIISWTGELLKKLDRGFKGKFSEDYIRSVQYRPFTCLWLYFDPSFVERPSSNYQYFPRKVTENRIICTGVDSSGGFSIFMSKMIPDANFVPRSKCFPRWCWTDCGEQADNVSISVVNLFRQKFHDPQISSDQIFNYVYGLLHSEDYRDIFKNNLTKEMPRIPVVDSKEDFRKFVQAGAILDKLHVDYEAIDCWPVKFEKGGFEVPSGISPKSWFRVQKMKLANKNDFSCVIYNDNITIANIPIEAWQYSIGGKPALKWVMERQSVKTDEDSQIVNDANDFANETKINPAHPLELFLRVITVSVETTRVVKSLPKLIID